MKDLWTRKKKGWIGVIIAIPIFFWILSQVLPAAASWLNRQGFRKVQHRLAEISGTLTCPDKRGSQRILFNPLTFPLNRRSHPELDREKFLLRLVGLLSVEQAGFYWIGCESDDGSWVRIDGEEVVENGGLHARQEKRNLIHLNRGIHPLEVRWENQMGEAYLDLFWIPPEGMRQPLPFLPHPWGKWSALLERLGFFSFKIAQYWTFLMLPLLLYPLLFPVRPSSGEEGDGK